MTTEQINEVVKYLTEQGGCLKIKYKGVTRNIFYNPQQKLFGIRKGKQKNGFVFTDFGNIEKVYFPKPEDCVEVNKRLLQKYQKMAGKASFTNDWLRDIAFADPEKGLYDNHITTGNSIDGKCISLKCIERYCGQWVMDAFRSAVQNKEKFNSCRFDFQGYDGTLWVNPHKDGKDVTAGFCKEYRNCGNGYYYLLINDDYVIGYDVD